MTQPWAVRLAAAAEADFHGIVRWTAERFGQRQALAYADILTLALAELAEGPDIIGVKSRDDIVKGLFTFHVARKGRKGRHLVLFKISKDRGRDVIEVLRVLHDAMDLPRHLNE